MTWQPIETAPADVAVLAYEGGSIYAATRRPSSHPDDADYFEAACGQPVVYRPEPTHWMPLPAPPTD